MLALDLGSLPISLRDVISSALPDGADCEEAIAAIEEHLAAGGQRSATILVALALLTFEDARRLVLHRLGEASRDALELLAEACALGATGLDALHARIAQSLEAEEQRAARLLEGQPAQPAELVELAHAMLRSDDEPTARWLLRRAGCLATNGGSGVFALPLAAS